MDESEQTTLERIHTAARQEFLSKGFRSTSLRNIVKTAGVTTGAFYGYFSSKEALFASIVEPHAAAVMGKFMTVQTEFAELPDEDQPEHMGRESAKCVEWMIDYMYEHYEEFKILIILLYATHVCSSICTKSSYRSRSGRYRGTYYWSQCHSEGTNSWYNHRH